MSLFCVLRMHYLITHTHTHTHTHTLLYSDIQVNRQTGTSSYCLLVGWRVIPLLNKAILEISDVVYVGHVWGICRPRQIVNVVHFLVLYDSSCMGLGVVTLIKDTT